MTVAVGLLTDEGLPCRPYLLTLARGIVGDDAEDVLNDVWLSAWAQALVGDIGYQGPAQWRALFRLKVVRAALNFKRDLALQRDREQEWAMQQPQRDTTKEMEQRVMLDELVDRLPPRHYNAWVWVVREGHSTRDVARRIGVSQATVHRQVAEANQLLLRWGS